MINLPVKNVVKKNFYRDSLQLLHLSEQAKKIEGVMDAAVIMGTKTNKEILEKLGLLVEEGKIAGESDMVIAVSASTEEIINKAVETIEKMLTKPPKAGQYFYSLETALEALPDANLAIVSVPGEYAKEITLKLLDRGIHVHLFSDHVPIEDELEIKEYAKERGLLVMGAAAGTSIINNKAIAFANVVNKGPIGIVAAAGTGLQEVSVLITVAGSGVSQGIGIGGGDVKKKVGGIMALESIKALEKDTETKVVTLVAKPPDPEVQKKILDYITYNTKKKYVTCFMGGKVFEVPNQLKERLVQTRTLHAAALESVRLLDEKLFKEAEKKISIPAEELLRKSEKLYSQFEEKQKYIRGLFTGGTLTYESLIILKETLGDIYSNAPLEPRLGLKNPYKSFQHTVVDLGEEEFTIGRAHPMIDPTIRNLRLIEEAKDPEVAVILLDFVLGYGSHSDPAEAHTEAIRKAKETAEKNGRYLAILAHVCGTDRDPQNLSLQTKKLESLGVTVLPTNALMAILASAVASKGRMKEDTLERTYESFLFPQ